MLKSGRKPRNESEQMIFNNLRSIKLITEEIDKPLDFALIIELHKTMTASTSEYCLEILETNKFMFKIT